MIITICGSIKFFDEMKKAKEDLEKAGHSVFLPIKVKGVDYWAEDNAGRVNAKRQLGLISEHMDKIEKSDAVLVVNVTKNDVEHYVGANTFVEICFAHYRKKKVYFLNPIPSQKYILDELEAVEPVILNGDLAKIV